MSKVRKGNELLFSKGQSNKWNDMSDFMIINFKDKDTYVGFKQKGNHLLINTTKGEVDIVFTGEPPTLVFDVFCKDQLILKTKKTIKV